MNFVSQLPGPVAIGGLGGSGTRLIAEILKQIGFYIGSDLNAANDNLWFCLLFKRPGWYFKHVQQRPEEIFKAMRIFADVMAGTPGCQRGDNWFIWQAAVTCSIYGNHHGGVGSKGRGLWPFLRFVQMARAKKPLSPPYLAWGWKEPNTHIYLAFLAKYFSDLKYIHVVRHGLDMAYSRNQAQLFNWGQNFSVDARTGDVPIAKNALAYWIRANENAVQVGTRTLGQRFHLVNYDQLCQNPVPAIREILNFLNWSIQPDQLTALASLAKVPKSIGRYRQMDLSIFTRSDIKAVEKFGFTVEKTRCQICPSI